MSRLPLDMYDTTTPEMRAYLRNYGWSFSKRACEEATKRMKRLNPATGKKERIEPLTREQVEELLDKYGIELEHNTGYDFVYIANMARADFYKSAIPDEQHLALYIKDVIDDPDNEGGNVFRHWLVDMDKKGEPIPWEEML